MIFLEYVRANRIEALQTLITSPSPFFEPFYYLGLFGNTWDIMDYSSAHKYSMLNTMAWHWTALIVYLIICVFDFMVVPIWFGFMRPDYHTFLEEVRMIDDTMIQLELMKKLTQHHSPYTLQMGGLFHLAFGALLTGSAFGLKK